MLNCKAAQHNNIVCRPRGLTLWIDFEDGKMLSSSLFVLFNEEYRIMPRKQQECVYCGSMSETQMDHVVPGVLFPKPRPQLITVPACARCNLGFSKDEEYFVTTLVGEAVAFGSDQAEKVIKHLFHNVPDKKVPRRRSLARRIKQQFQEVEVNTNAGLHLGSTHITEIEEDRYNRILEKIVRGLFYIEEGRILPKDSTVKVEIKPEPDVLETYKSRLLGMQWKAVGDLEVFTYCFAHGQKDNTAWLMCFYRSTTVIAETIGAG